MSRELTQNQQDQIDNIMDNFDFHKVNRHMILTNWTWGFDEIPTLSELRGEARRLLTTLFVEKLIYTATGGFIAIRYTGTDEKEGDWERIRLFFSIEEWNTMD